MPNLYDARQAIAALPGKTVRPWRDGDERCHCSHCDLCGECYPTAVIGKHTEECIAALIAALSNESVSDHPLGAKACPFCGGEPRPALRRLGRLGSINAASFAVVCDGCRARGPLKSPAAVALDFWNKARRPHL